MVMPMPNGKLVLRNVKLTEDENKQLKKDAYAHEMNVSEYLRWLIERERVRRMKPDFTGHTGQGDYTN